MQKLALLFAINTYAPAVYGAGSDLRQCIKDGVKMQAILRAEGYDEVTLLTNDQCTEEEWRARMADFRGRMKPGDTLTFFQSSHGTYYDLNGKRITGLCMQNGVLWDFQASDEWRKFEKGVKINYFVDACFSESTWRLPLPPGMKAKYTQAVNAEPPVPTAVDKRKYKCGFVALTSSTVHQQSFEVESGGLFTTALINALKVTRNPRQVWQNISIETGKYQTPTLDIRGPKIFTKIL